MKLIIKDTHEKSSIYLAEYISQKINTHNKINPQHPFVLGLPTGGSIEKTYEYLIHMHKQNKLSFQNVITFNMDEYIGLDINNPQSYAYFMHQKLFSHIDIKQAHINLPNGKATDIAHSTKEYEDKIKFYGGIDLFVGGIGQNGHLAFNEPFSSLTSYTREKTLSPQTREANSRFFESIDKVPSSAITVGTQTVMNSKEIVIIISGQNKAHALKELMEGPIRQMYPATILQMHAHASIICDEDATEELQVKTYKYFKNLERTHKH